MMSKKQWFVLLGLLIIYILLGASFFYQIETREESARRELDKEERKIIEELLHKHYIPTQEDTEEEIFSKLQTYCGKPMRSNVSDAEDPPLWDFYHSVFFVITVVTTIGYGNLAPTTSMVRIVMIFYALIGIPVNGLVMVSLGDFFGKSYISLYRRWKTAKMEYDTTRLGLIAQIILYLVPGFTFFIFLPAVIIMVFEGWDYTLAVYYAFVTLTTIGFGDYVAGVNHPGEDSIIYLIYKLFLLVWIIIGLGYVLMVLGFISSGLRSKKMHAIEHALATHIKQTPRKIRSELRALVHEFLLLKVKRVYKDEFVYTPTELQESQSCPDLTIYRNTDSPTMLRKRALSECAPTSDLVRIQSDTDLHFIDKERTFNRKVSEQSNLLLRVANALSGLDDSDSDSDKGIDGFSDNEILGSETIAPSWITDNQKTASLMPGFKRRRAFSEVKFPFGSDPKDNNSTWYGPPSSMKLQEIREEAQHGKARCRTLPIQPPQPASIISKIKNTFKNTKDDKEVDIEKQEIVPRRDRIHSIAVTNRYLRQTRSGRNSLFSSNNDSVLEETSIADFLRILSDMAESDTEEPVTPLPQRKLGTASLTPPTMPSPRTRRFSVRPTTQPRRGSLINPALMQQRGRRYSLSPAALFEPIPTRRASLIPTLAPVFPDKELSLKSTESSYVPPPPYTPLPTEGVRRSIRVPGSNRRFSLRPVTLAPNLSPVQRQVLRKENKDNTKENKDDSKDSFDEKL